MIPISCKNLILATIITFSLFLANAAMADVTPGTSASKTILVFGDSLVSGYGIPLEKSFPAVLEQKLQAGNYNVKVINAGVSGDTTSGGLTRLEWTLGQKPDYVILELGANDMLRGTDPKVTEENLQKMLQILKDKKIPVLLTGTRATPNLGIIFTDSYLRMYKRLARKFDTVLYPFFLDGVFLERGLMQEDNMHPSEAGVVVIVDKILPSVKELLEK